METKKIVLTVLLGGMTLLLAGCPIDDDDVLGGDITITNNSATSFDEVWIDSSCLAGDGGWNGSRAADLPAGGSSGTYSVSADIATDTFDVRACNFAMSTCYQWLDLDPIAGGSTSVSTSDGGSGPFNRDANC